MIDGWPDGELTDDGAVTSARKYLDFYGQIDDQPYDGGETCVHGVHVDDDCDKCCEEFMVMQFAVCRADEGQTEAEVVRFVQSMHGLDKLIPAETVADLVGVVFSNPGEYRYETQEA